MGVSHYMNYIYLDKCPTCCERVASARMSIDEVSHTCTAASPNSNTAQGIRRIGRFLIDWCLLQSRLVSRDFVSCLTLRTLCQLYFESELCIPFSLRGNGTVSVEVCHGDNAPRVSAEKIQQQEQIELTTKWIKTRKCGPWIIRLNSACATLHLSMPPVVNFVDIFVQRRDHWGHGDETWGGVKKKRKEKKTRLTNRFK